MSTKPEDDDTPPMRPRVKTDPAGVRMKTPGRGTPIGAIVERGGGRAGGRDMYGPRRYEDWDSDKTPPTTDPELYRAVRSIKRQTDSQDIEIAVIKKSVQTVEGNQGRMDDKLDRIAESHAALAAVVTAKQNSLTITETKMVATQTATAATEDTLAKRVLTIEERKQKFWERIWVKVVSGIFSVGVLTAAIALIAQRC